MKAFLENDIIMHIHHEGDTEIGDLPKGVGLERLRFDGVSVVDLATLSQFWVEETRGGGFILHVVEVANSQSVSMSYAERKYLTNDNGTIRLKTVPEVLAERSVQKAQDASTRLFRKLQTTTGTLEMRQLQTLMLVCALIVYARQSPPKLAAFFDKIIPHIKDAFPLDRVEALLMNAMRDLKQFTEQYWKEME